ncbi:MAG TPA: AAA family ATPase [Phycisphaerae bacterium]|nr:AAA family ATPase [Phycisphaerae bacterium]HRY69073.1 AAA family ATPase [Phycisphaerae bacterium]HSA25952.1 AAA family ATPase [Phycisphaerae bacterium]
MKMTVDGLKGLSDSFDIRPLNLYVGPNGCGKSTRLEALCWALTGQTRLGKSPEAAAALCSNGHAIVDVSLPDGFGWRREVRRDPLKGSVSSDLHVHGKEDGKLADAQAAIDQRCGGLTAGLDLSAFTSLSADRRRAYVLSLCESAGSVASAARQLAQLDLAVLDSVLGGGQVKAVALSMWHREPFDLEIEQADQVSTALWKTAPAEIRDAWQAVMGLFGADASDDVLQTVTAWMDLSKQLKSEHKKAREQASAATQKLTQDKNELRVSAELVETLRARIVECERELAEVQRQIGAFDGAARNRAALVGRIEQCRAKVGDTERQLAVAYAALQSRDWDGERQQIEAQLGPDCEVMRADRAERLDRAKSELEAARMVDCENREEVGSVETLICLAEADSVAADQSIKRIKAQIENLGRNPWIKVQKLLARLTEAIVEKFGTDTLNELAGRIEEIGDLAERELTVVLEAINAAEIERENAITNSDNLVGKLGALRADLAAARKRYDDAHDRMLALEKTAHDLDESDRLYHVAKGQLATLEREMAVANGAVETYQALLEEARANVELAETELEGFDDTAGEAGDRDRLELRLAEIEGEIGELRAEVERKGKLQALTAELSKCIAKSAEEAALFECATHTEKAVKSLREVLLAGQVRPLLHHIDRFLHEAGLKVRAYCSLSNARGKAEFDLGWVLTLDDGREVNRSMDTMSGGEAALFGAALAYALTVMSDVPLKTLTVEADAVDQVNLGLMLAGFAGVRDEIDYVLVATCHGPASVADGWHVVQW